jgi:hypothetical protein
MNTIETLFAPYDLAVKLKPLGFDEPCFGHFLGRELTLLRVKGYRDGVELLAPTFSQAFRWFREKGYRFNVINDVSQVDGDYFYDVWFNGKFLFESHESSNTYEEAELACLTKLIEIAETL